MNQVTELMLYSLSVSVLILKVMQGCLAESQYGFFLELTQVTKPQPCLPAKLLHKHDVPVKYRPPYALRMQGFDLSTDGVNIVSTKPLA